MDIREYIEEGYEPENPINVLVERQETLKKLFRYAYFHRGDEELISNCNSEYSFDESDVIMTDGVINFFCEIVNNVGYTDNKPGKQPLYIRELKSQSIHYQQAVRGATYILVATPKTEDKVEKKENLEWDYMIYCNIECVDTKYDEIINKLKKLISLTMTDGEMNYFIKEWRCTGGIIPNDLDIDDIYTISEDCADSTKKILDENKSFLERLSQ